jgi:alpha-tubulin suppressor-like RCC1 family protein
MPDAMPCAPAVEVSTLAAGGGFGCAELADRSIACWGDNSQGQLGDGTLTSRSAAASPLGLGAVESYSAGTGHACAVEAGVVYCWGRNDVGQLGIGSNEYRRQPTQVPELPDGISGVAAGGLVSCAWNTVGALYCWGQRNGTATNASRPRPVTGVPPIMGAALGSADRKFSAAHSCVLGTDQSAWCFGDNADGQLGDGTQTASATPVAVTGGHAFVQLATGDYHTCGLTDGGDVYCWGGNYDGQVGDGTGQVQRTEPVRVALDEVAELDAGGDFTCARTEGGDVYCWGDNDLGQLGRAGADARAPERIPLPPALALAVGTEHACALAGDGIVRCWGADRGGIRGGTASTVAVVVPELGGVTQVDAGDDATCARLESGAVRCWGHNALGQLGDGTMLDRARPVDAELDDAVTQVSLGTAHGCARHGDGSVACWGDNELGQVRPGSSNTGVIATPALVDLDPAASGVTTGGGYSCAAVEGAAPWCWGYTSEGRLGISGAGEVVPPTMSGFPAAAAIVAGNNHTCAVTPAGALYCAGRDNEGQIGNGSTANGDVYVPEQIAGAPEVAAVAVGRHHTCAVSVTADTTWCWGENTSGQVGDGSQAVADSPVALGLTGIVEVAAARHHSCARDGDGNVWCWGANPSGQLGDGSLTSSLVPVRATQLDGVTQLALGRDHSCGLEPGGTVRCVGNRTFGQLGDGQPSSIAPAYAPVTCPAAE